jgi:hypothetical protein
MVLEHLARAARIAHDDLAAGEGLVGERGRAVHPAHPHQHVAQQRYAKEPAVGEAEGHAAGVGEQAFEEEGRLVAQQTVIAHQQRAAGGQVLEPVEPRRVQHMERAHQRPDRTDEPKVEPVAPALARVERDHRPEVLQPAGRRCRGPPR